MATHSSILAWRIPWTEELCGLQSMGRKESDMTEQLHFHFPEVIVHWQHDVQFCGIIIIYIYIIYSLGIQTKVLRVAYKVLPQLIIL